ncbi:MAG: ArnT family glycosyltransferase [Thermodesulfobacteriota bacterium]
MNCANKHTILHFFLHKYNLSFFPRLSPGKWKDFLNIYLQTKPKISLAIIIGFFSALRLGVAPFFGLGVDEAHYVLYAKFLDLSYVDHPPLVGWVHSVIFYTLGTNEFLARLPAILIFAGTSYLAYRFLWYISRSVPISLAAVWALNSSFLFNALGLMLLPDSLLLPLAFLFLEIVLKIAAHGQRKHFLYLGLILGVSGLAKYTAILFLPALCFFFLRRRRLTLLFSKNFFLAALIAGLSLVPVLIWNGENDWISFRYQGQHLTSFSAHMLKNFLFSLLGQFLSYSPFLFGVACYGFIKSWSAPNERIFLSFLLGASNLIFFSFFSFFEVILPHWNCFFYLLFIPLGVYYLERGEDKRKKKILKICIGVSFALTIFLYAELAGKFFRFPDFRSPFQDIYGWDHICQEANRRLKENPRSPKALAVTNWTMGSRVMYYSLPYENEVFVIDNRRDQFDIWQKKDPYGYDLLFVQTYFEKVDIGQKFKCAQIIPSHSLELTLNGGKVNKVDLVWCQNYQGMKNE